MQDKEGVKAVTRTLLLPVIAAAWLIQAPLLMQLGVLGGLLGLILAWKHVQAGNLLRKALISVGVMLGLAAGNASAEQIYYVHTDHLNTPTLVTDSNKTVVWEGVRKPFGEIEEIVNSVRQPIRFPGQYFDGETGLSYNLMRDYDARVGRYVQSDPIGLMGGVNLYAYANNNPQLYIDTFGLAPACTQCESLVSYCKIGLNTGATLGCGGVCTLMCNANVLCVATCSASCAAAGSEGAGRFCDQAGAGCKANCDRNNGCGNPIPVPSPLPESP
ncbi:Hypothetical protein HDN1F_24500 [gamma proteobacterium HdN1]|nr:Hypothetical protein HDN1F_24500 [gamma proteobacterium HdN1]